MIAVHLEPMMSAVQATAHSSSWTARIVRICALYRRVSSVPGRRVVHPAAADHRGHDLDLAELLDGAVERVAVEHDEVGEGGRGFPRRRSSPVSQAGATQVACRACSTVTACSGCQASRSSRDRRTPALIEERIELLDRRVGAVGHDRARVDQRAEGVGAVGLPSPELVGEVAVGGSMAELNGCGDASSAKRPTSSGARSWACSIRGRRPRACATPPASPRRRRARAGCEVADRVNGDRKAGLALRRTISTNSS